MGLSAQNSSTIFALATPFARGAVAVVRVSGAHAFDSLNALTAPHAMPPFREARVRKLLHPVSKCLIDSALVLTFQNPHSFTGEDCVEYHLHGGLSVINGLLDALATQPHHRMASPGEFTRRGFEHGKFDLTEAEAIADLIDAETEAQRVQALHQLSGSLEQLYRGWADQLAHNLALMEADLDFSDQDLPDDILLRVRPDVSGIAAQIAAHLNDGGRGERLRNGFQMVLLGAPNVGKSSMLNRLTMRDVAIVSPLAGTTRDIIETHIDIHGYPVILADMAGLRCTIDNDDTPHADIERLGMERARARAAQADIVLHVFDGAHLPAFDATTAESIDHRSIVVVNKADELRLNRDDFPPVLRDAVVVSSLNGAGYDALLLAVKDKIEQLYGGVNANTPSLTRARHRDALNHTLQSLARVEHAELPELAAEDMRLALRHLGSITGRVDVEDLLDMIFRDFCIGK